MNEPDIAIAPLREADLPAVNAVVERAVMGWNLPERVKRLSLPSYRYRPEDLQHQQGWVARVAGRVVGVAVWEPAPDEVVPGARRVERLHGLYVDPAWQGRGIGRRVLDAVIRQICANGADGLVIRAQADAVPFFRRHGLQALPVTDAARDYPHRFWQPCREREMSPVDGHGQIRHSNRERRT